MTRLEELTIKLADDVLTDVEASELEVLLATQSEAAAPHTRLLEIEVALRGQRETLDLAGPTLTRLRSELGASVERGVMQQLETAPLPPWTRTRTITPSMSHAGKLRWFAEIFPWRWPLPKLARPTMLAFAASVILLLSLGVWLFGPTMGQPVIAEVKGMDASIERGTEFIPTAKGMSLRSGDVVRLGTNASATITFGVERTRFELTAGTELKLISLAHGKRYLLASGKIRASVARQRPFHPMIFTTPQAEARVLGTKFSLLTTANATRLEVSEGKVQFTRSSDGSSTKVTAGQYAVVAANYELLAQPLTGSILREYWTNVPGEYFMDFLTKHRDFPDHPSGRDYLDKFETPSHWGTNYGARLRGYLHPPTTGEYTFWIAAGDGGQFFLSPDDDLQKRQQIAYANATALHEWTRIPGQQTSPITLIAGRKYYVEVMQKQGTNREDHLAVAWQGPGRARQVIPGEFLSPFIPKPKGQK
ncbi:MAG: FecR domain-containing protein [Verrucomicrobia bacterium]|nr:FecR domain-containing protein [Verrucomicrobiota bacterium]